MVCEIAGKRLHKRHVAGPTGVRGRRSDNRLITETLHWRPTQSLMDGLEKTYAWIESQLLRSAA
jgi:nucleoside-diphosphate-sugar epimerase